MALTNERVDLLTFYFEGATILNPFKSPCGSHDVDPRTYGFEECHTGGGCMALIKPIEDGHTLWLTDCDGSDFPELDDVGTALYGRYDLERDQIAICQMSDLEQASSQESAPDTGPTI